MKSVDALYKFGHLYDRMTNKRILITDDAQVSIVLNEEHILKEDLSIVQKARPLKKEELLDALKMKYTYEVPYWLMLEAGKSLFFKIEGYVPKAMGNEAFTLEFRMELLEDLYIYNKKRKRKDMAQLFPCKCVISECLTDNFQFFEPVYGDSLNKARTKLHELYFSRIVNPASNAFREFYLDRSYNHKNKNLGSLRLKVQQAPSINDVQGPVAPNYML